MTLRIYSKIILLVLAFSTCTLYSQNATVAAGGNASSGTGTVSYTVGQITYTTNANANFSVAQGVQQPFEISVLSVDEHIPAAIELKAYPNPTMEDVTLDIGTLDTAGLQVLLLDISGRTLQEDKITYQLTTLNFAALPSSTYLVKVTSYGKNIKTFKIIKK